MAYNVHSFDIKLHTDSGRTATFQTEAAARRWANTFTKDGTHIYMTTPAGDKEFTVRKTKGNHYSAPKFKKGDRGGKSRKPTKAKNPQGKAATYHYHVTGPQGGKYLTSTMEEARKITKNGGTIRKLKKPRKG
jgi:hypothetical protein